MCVCVCVCVCVCIGLTRGGRDSDWRPASARDFSLEQPKRNRLAASNCGQNEKKNRTRANPRSGVPTPTTCRNRHSIYILC